MLAIYAYGTNTGIRAVAAGGGHGHTEDEIRYVRRRYLTRDTRPNRRDRYRQRHLRRPSADDLGEGSTAFASYSTHFRSYAQNVFTEWQLALRRARDPHLLARRTRVDGRALLNLRPRRRRSRRWSKAPSATTPR